MDGQIVNILNSERFTGEDGIDYTRYTKEILTPRKTFVKGEISGKYRGDRMLSFENLQPNASLFDFEIYEAKVVCESRENFSTEPFELQGKMAFPRDKLPKKLLVSILANNLSYDVNILEPALYDFHSIPKFRQVHGDETYGRFTAYITGYVFDYAREEIAVVEEFVKEAEVVPKEVISPVKDVVVSGDSSHPLYGKVYSYDSGGNVRHTWQYRGHRATRPVTQGCMEGAFGFIGIFLGVSFLLILLPSFGYVLLLGLAFFVFRYFASGLKWIFRILGGLLFLLFFLGLLVNWAGKGNSASNLPKTEEDARETVTPINPEPIAQHERNRPTATRAKTQKPDQVIRRFRSWQDYDGNKYEGFYTVKLSDFEKAHAYKNAYQMASNGQNAYDLLVYRLKENDKNALEGLYVMLDSIQKANALSETGFAQMAVSMVQDIPYSLVLEQDCDPNLYEDAFISQWLSKPDASCDPRERFGINTPVEFLTNLKGDCDTRTLLLYTILSHYGYDVILLSSEFYRHSILAVDLAADGTTYEIDGVRYVLWETTSKGTRPGIISPSMKNMNNWRISLKSKTL